MRHFDHVPRDGRPHYFHDSWCRPTSDILDAEVCVYGGNAAGVAAAVSAAEEGKRVVLLHPGAFLGGMTTGGLSYTDIGNTSAIGGFARRLYTSIGHHYHREISWVFEPRVASVELDRVLSASGVFVRLGEYIAYANVKRRRLTEIGMLSGLRVRAQVFIDTTYEGDLMAAAGVPYAVGRESREEFGEEYAGVQVMETHQFDVAVSPYVDAGRRESGLLPMVRPVLDRDHLDAMAGRGDRSVQAYNFRVCMTTNESNRVPFPKPPGYDESHYLLAARWLQETGDDIFTKFDFIAEGKTDTNNHGAVSTDYIGGSHAWPEADYRTRELIFQDHLRYQQGLHWFMANDERVPEPVRREYSRWGLAADEFVESGHWPHQLYVREARRMRGDLVLTEHHCLGRKRAGEPIGLASYQMDSHNCNRLAVGDTVLNEGDVQVKLPAPYPIPYRAIVPPEGTCDNLLVPVALSATHIAYGSVRMEPVFMILGESAAVAACQAIEIGAPVGEISYHHLEKRLRERGQVLESDVPNPFHINP